MARKLPPFAAAKAFEAAARYSNYQLAAAELGITASAVSHHVKALEDFLGVKLFVRKNNRLFLGAEGDAYYRELSSSLDRIEEATTRITRRHGRKQLTIRLFASLVEMWLMPRLGEFIEKHPDIFVRLVTRMPLEDDTDPSIDLDIRYLPEQGEPIKGDFLFADEIVPVCSPQYLSQTGDVRQPLDLTGRTLIVCSGEPDEWSLWAEMAGVSLDRVNRWLEFDQRAAVLSAAKEGLGFAMGRRPYADIEFSGGRLVAPIRHAVPTGYAYYLMRSPVTEELEEVQAFCDWLLEICASIRKPMVA